MRFCVSILLFSVPTLGSIVDAGFLEKELPLRVTQVIPSEKKDLAPSDAIQVQFSRPVIALGEDYLTDETSSVSKKRFYFEDCDTQERLEIPGDYRWVTTYLLRFDPAPLWPTDLCFRVKIPEALTSYDGVPLTWNTDGQSGAKKGITYSEYEKQLQFSTDSISTWITLVRSKKAEERTDGGWDSRLSYREDNLVECPPDAFVTLQFSTAVDVSLLRKAITVRAKTEADAMDKPSLESVVGCDGPDGPSETSCVVVAPRGLLRSTAGESPTVYVIEIPFKSRYHGLAGGLRRPLQVEIAGLAPFRFPFLREMNFGAKEERVSVNFKRHLLHIPHGLEYSLHETDSSSLAAVLEKLKASFAYEPKVSFDLSLLNNSTLQVLGAFQPDTSYNLVVSNSRDIKDVFGLPLSGDIFKFKTHGQPAFVLSAGSAQFPITTFSSSQLEMLSKEGEQYVLESLVSSYAGVVGDQFNQFGKVTVTDHCAYLRLDSADAAFEKVITSSIRRAREGLATSPLTNSELFTDYHAVEFSFEPRLEGKPINRQTGCRLPNDIKSGTILAHQRFTDYVQKGRHDDSRVHNVDEVRLVTVADFSASVVDVSPSPDSMQLLFWITDKEGTFNVKDEDMISIKLFASERTRGKVGFALAAHWEEPARKVADGQVTLDLVSQNIGRRTYTAFIQVEGQGLVVIQNIRKGTFQNWKTDRNEDLDLRIIGTTDRGMYKPGESAHVKVFARAGDRLKLKKLPDSVSVVVNGFGSTEQVHLDAFGEGSAVLLVQDNVRYGRQMIQIHNPNGKGWFKVPVLVATPRIPAATMALSTNQTRVDPYSTSSPLLSLETKTYTGSPIPDANVKVSWHVQTGFSVSPLKRGYLIEYSPMDSISPDGSKAGCRPREGSLAVASDNSGSTRFSIDFAEVQPVANNPPRGAAALDSSAANEERLCDLTPGSSVKVVARWDGPTGEELHSELTLQVHPQRQLTVFAPSRPAPGFPFRIAVDVVEDESESRSAEDCCTDQTRVDCAACNAGTSAFRFCSASAHKRDDWKAVCLSMMRVEVRLMAVGAAPFPRGQLADPSLDSGTLAALAERLGLRHLPTAASTSALHGCNVSLHEAAGRSAEWISKDECLLSLPEVGQFAIVASTVGYDGLPIRAVHISGAPREDWVRSPMTFGSLPPLALRDAGAGLGGQTEGKRDHVVLEVVNPFPKASALFVYGFEGKTFKVLKRFQDAGLHSVAIELDDCFKDDQQVDVFVMLRPRSFSEYEASFVSMPMKPGFSWDMLAFESFKESITATIVKASSMNVFKEISDVQVSVDKPFASPGSSVSISINVPSLASSQGQVSIYVVDKAQLDMAAPQPLDYRNGFKGVVNLRRYMSTGKLGQRITADVVREAERLWMTLQEVEPSFCPLHGDAFHQFSLGCPHIPTRLPVLSPEELEKLATFAITLGVRGRHDLFRGEVAEEMVMDDAVAESEPVFASLTNSNVKPMMMMRSAPQAMMAKTAVMSSGADLANEESNTGGGVGHIADQNAPTARVRTSFNPVPLVVNAHPLDPSGRATVALTLPDDVGTFQVRAYVVGDDTRQARFGQSEAVVVSRLPLSVVAAAPRLVRTGDKFSPGVVVTLLEVPAGGCTLVAEAQSSSEELIDLSSRTVRLPVTSEGPHRLTFGAEAGTGAIGNATITVKVSAFSKGGVEVASDALEMVVPVMASEHLLSMSSTVAMRLSPSATVWPEGLKIPPLVTGTGELEVSAGFGYSAAQVQVARKMIEDATHPELKRFWWDRCLNTIAAQIPSRILVAYGMSETSELMTGVSELSKRANSALDVCFHRLVDENSLQANEWQIVQSMVLQTLSEVFKRDGFSNPNVNAMKSLLFKRTDVLREKLLRILLQRFQSCQRMVQSQKGTRKSVDLMCKFSMETVSRVRLVLGMQWTPSLAYRAIGSFLDVAKLLEAAQKGEHCSQECQVNVALMLALRSPEEDLLQLLLKRISDNVRVQGSTAYVSRPRSRHSSGLVTNSKALVALVLGEREPGTFPSLSLVASWISEQVTLGSVRAQSAPNLAVGSLALAWYDATRQTLQGSGTVTARTGPTLVLEGRWRGTQDPMQSNAVAWLDVLRAGSARADPSPPRLSQPPPLVMRAQGSRGEIVVTTRLSLIPKLRPPVSGVYRGLRVDKVVRRYDAVTRKASGPAVLVLEPGEVVQVAIQVTSPDDLGPVRLVDLLPGGLEPMDEHLSKDAAAASGRAPSFQNPGRLWQSNQRSAPWMWPRTFQDKQTMRDRVVWESRWFPAGSATVTYLARAVTPGLFRFGSASAFALDNPELMGQSGGAVDRLAVVGHERPKGFAAQFDVSPESPSGRAKLREVGLVVEPSSAEGGRPCDAGCAEVNAFCLLAAQVCACEDGSPVTGSRSECPALAQRYSVEELRPPRGFRAIEFELAVEAAAGVAEAAASSPRGADLLDDWAWGLKESIAAIFPRHEKYDVAPQDVELVLRQVEGRRLELHCLVVLWAFDLAGLREEELLQFIPAFVTADAIGSTGWAVTRMAGVRSVRLGEPGGGLGAACGGASDRPCRGELVCTALAGNERACGLPSGSGAVAAEEDRSLVAAGTLAVAGLLLYRLRRGQARKESGKKTPLSRRGEGEEEEKVPFKREGSPYRRVVSS